MEIMLSTSIYEKNMNKINKSGIHTKQMRLQTDKHLTWIEVINIIITACHHVLLGIYFKTSNFAL